MQKLEITLQQLPESLRKQVVSLARKHALTIEQRRVARALDALKRAGLATPEVEFELPAVLIIKLK